MSKQERQTGQEFQLLPELATSNPMEYARIATEEFYDYGTVAKALDTGITLYARGNSAGMDIVKGIGAYFANGLGSSKYLVEPANPQVIAQLDKNLRHVEHLMQRGVVQPGLESDRNLQLLLINLQINLRNALTQDIPLGKIGTTAIRMSSFIDRTSDASRERVVRGNNVYEELTAKMNRVEVNPEKSTIDNVLAQEDAIDTMRRRSFRSVAEIADPWRHKFRGVTPAADYEGISIQDIFNEADDIETKGMKFLELLQNLPAGDLVWEQIKQKLLLNTALPPLGDEERSMLSSTRYVRQLFEIRTWMFHKLFLPAFSDHVEGVTPDADFDAYFDAAVAKLGSNSAAEMVAGMIQSISHAPFIARQYRNIASIDESFKDFPLQSLALRESGARLARADEQSVAFFQRNQTTITDNLRTRLHGDKAKILIDQVEAFLENSYYDTLSKEFNEYIGSHITSSLREQLTVRGEQIHQLTSDLKESISQLGHFSLNADVGHTVDFNEGSFAKALGITKITFAVRPDDHQHPFEFVLHTEDVNLNGWGLLTESREVEGIAQEESSELTPMLQLLVLSAFHDLTNPSISRVSERSKIRRSEEMDPVPAIESKVRSRKLPRRSRLPKEETVISSFTLAEAGEIVRQHANQPVRLRSVDPYRLPLRDTRNIRQIMAEINQYGETPTLKQQLEQALDLLTAKPNPEKISPSKIPPGIQLRTVPHPKTGEIVYLDTWVRGHYRPPLTDEEKRSLPALFKKYYQGTGSALALLDEFNVWIEGADLE